MNPCYIVKFKDLKSPQLGVRKVRIGYFPNQQAAEQHASSAYGVSGYGELISVHPETPVELWLHRVSRFIVRALRIVAAAAIALLVYSWLFGSGDGIGNVPLSSLTLNMLFSALFKGLFAVGVFWLCLFIGFGSGPEH